MLEDIAALFPGVSAEHGALAFWVTVFGFFVAGLVKGTIAFALPLVSVAVGSMVLPPQVIVALVAIPAFFTNLLQALRSGPAAALATFRDFWRLILVMLLALYAGAQLLPYLDRITFGIVLGTAVLLFAIAQLAGWRPRVPEHRRGLGEVITGFVAGFLGGVSGSWGPPTLMLLLSLPLDKAALVRACGVIWFLGSLAFITSHISTGILTPERAMASAVMMIPALIGMRIGQMLQDRLPFATLRLLILATLAVVGLALIGRAIGG